MLQDDAGQTAGALRFEKLWLHQSIMSPFVVKLLDVSHLRSVLKMLTLGPHARPNNTDPLELGPWESACSPR